MGWKEDRELFDNNKRIIREIIESTNKLGWNEIAGLKFLINSASREEYEVYIKYLYKKIKTTQQKKKFMN